MMKTNLEIDGNSHINIHLQTSHKGRRTLLTVCSSCMFALHQHTFILDIFCGLGNGATSTAFLLYF